MKSSSNEWLRLPGLYRRWDFELVIKPGEDFYFEESGRSKDDEPLFTLYHRKHIEQEDVMRTEPVSVEIPTVHLNGTDGNSLLEQVTNVGDAAREMLKALEQAAPHGRDYYVNGPDSLKRAEAEHRSRVIRVRSVFTEVEMIAEGIVSQIDRRES